MAHATMALVLEAKPYGPAQRFALYRVAEVVNDLHDWGFWMTPAKLADEVGVSEGRVRTFLAEFVRDGWLEVTERGGGRGNHTRYRWNLNRLSASGLGGNRADGGPKPRGGANPSSLLTEVELKATDDPQPVSRARVAASNEELNRSLSVVRQLREDIA